MGLITTSPIMQYAVVFVAFLALANGQFTCDECKQGVTALGQYLQTPNEIAAVEQALSDLVCLPCPKIKLKLASISYIAIGRPWPQLCLPMKIHLLIFVEHWDIVLNSKGPLESESHVLIAMLKWLNLLVFWLIQPLLPGLKTILLDQLIVNLPTM